MREQPNRADAHTSAAEAVGGSDTGPGRDPVADRASMEEDRSG